MLNDGFIQARSNGSRAWPGPMHEAKKGCRPGPSGSPDRHLEAGVFVKLNFNFHNVFFLSGIQSWIACS